MQTPVDCLGDGDVRGFGGVAGESEDSGASDIGSIHDPMDEDVPDDGSDIFCNVPAVRRDIEIVLRAAPSEVGEEEVEDGGEEVVEGDAEWCRYCFGACRALGPF